MGDVAASGGYYVAAAADAVYAEAGTLTGSIGVVGGKIDLGGLYQRLGIRREGVERGARAGLLSEARGFRPDERAALRGVLRDLYDTFLERVAEGRRLDLGAVERLARGRVWSGRAAQGAGLVDAIGGPLEAIAEVRRRAGLAPDAPFLLEVYPRGPRLRGLLHLTRLALVALRS
jgi:protease-4